MEPPPPWPSPSYRTPHASNPRDCKWHIELIDCSILSQDFPLDATVKQSMAAPPHERPSGGPIASMIGLLRKRRFGVFAGLSAKAIEFAVSYAVTGACSGYAVRLLG